MENKCSGPLIVFIIVSSLGIVLGAFSPFNFINLGILITASIMLRRTNKGNYTAGCKGSQALKWFTIITLVGLIIGLVLTIIGFSAVADDTNTNLINTSKVAIYSILGISILISIIMVILAFSSAACFKSNYKCANMQYSSVTLSSASSGSTIRTRL